MTPLGWTWAAFVWGYALACFLVTDPIKLLAYRVLDAPNAARPHNPGAMPPGAGRPRSSAIAAARADMKAQIAG